MKKFTKTWLLIGTLVTFSNQSASIKVLCEYHKSTYDAVGEFYICDVDKLNVTSPDDATVTSVTGIHQHGKSNNDVEGFRCFGCNIEYFLKGLENIFWNIKSISFIRNKLKEVHQSDLKPFPNVEALILGHNRIEVVEEDLFKINRKLKVINFDNNPITHIDPNVFDNLNGLIYLWLDSLTCMHMNVNAKSIVIKEVIKVVKSNCTDMEYSTLDGKIKNLEIHPDSLNSTEFSQQFAELEENFKTSRYSNLSSFQQRIKDLSEIKETKEAKEAKEFAAKLPQTVKTFEEILSKNQAQITDIQIELKNIAIIITQNQAQIADVQIKLKEILNILQPTGSGQ